MIVVGNYAREQQVIAAIGKRIRKRREQAHEERIGKMLVFLVAQAGQHRCTPCASAENFALPD